MKIQLNITTLLIVIALFTATFFLSRRLGQLSRDNQIQTLSRGLEEALATKKSYVIQVDSLTEYVNQINNVLINDERLIKNLELDNKRLRELNIKHVDAIAKLKATVTVLSKKLESKDSIVIIKNECDSTDDANYLKLPVRMSYKDRWAFSRLYIDTLGVSLTDFGLYQTDVNLILGTQREKWFKKAVSVTAITTPNPYLNISPEQVSVVRPKPRWYERNIFWLGVGVIGGFFIP